MASYPTSASAAIGELDPASSNTLWAALLMGLRAPVGRHRSTMARLQVTRAVAGSWYGAGRAGEARLSAGQVGYAVARNFPAESPGFAANVR